MMDVGNDTRHRAASSQPEGSGSLDKKELVLGLQRSRRATVDWPALVNKPGPSGLVARRSLAALEDPSSIPDAG